MGYIDPACLKGASPDRAADLYALGVTLYECLTGKLPARAAADAGEGSSAAPAFEAVLVGERAPPGRATRRAVLGRRALQTGRDRVEGRDHVADQAPRAVQTSRRRADG